MNLGPILPLPKCLYMFPKSKSFQTQLTMNQERAKMFMRDFDKVLEKLRETTSVEKINELKEYFVNEYPEIFCVEYSFKEMNIEAERIAKHNKKIKDVEETLLTSISMEPFTNYEENENFINYTENRVISKSY